MSACCCCGHLIDDAEALGVHDGWGGRMDAYCHDCALARCDAYPGACSGGYQEDA